MNTDWTDWRIHRVGYVLFAIVLAASAGADDRASFDQAYAQYQRHIAANEASLALDSARDAHRLGSKVFGKRSANTANLAINYAVLLNDQNEYKQARKVLKGKAGALESRYGETAVELVPFLIQMGRAAKEPNTSLEYLQKAASLSRGYDDSLMEAQKNFDIMSILLARGGVNLTEPYVDRAYEIYADRLTAKDVRLGLMAYHKARWANSRQQFDEAHQYLEQSLTAFQGPADQPMGDLERNVRMQLVQVLEDLGQSEDATGHLLKLGAARPWSATAEPIYRKNARFPAEAVNALESGEVRLSFTIDENGFVVDPGVIESSSAALNDAAIEMIRGFRYAPRFVDGHAVVTPDVEYRESFQFGSSRQEGKGRPFSRPGERGFMNEDLFDTSDCSSPDSTSRSCELLGIPQGGGK